MTTQQATAHITQLDRIRHKAPFSWHTITTDGTRGKVTLVTLADQPTVGRWFACVGLHAIGFERDWKAHAWIVTFIDATKGQGSK